ncbi:MAG: GNAT family N-acetyltransferase [Pseudomonadota bacterium]
MTEPVQVRDATRGDAEAIAQMSARFHAFHDLPGGVSAEIIRRDAFGDPAWFELLVAEQAASTIGYALFHKSYETGQAMRGLYLSDLWVEPDARRCGVGRALMTALGRRARVCGAEFVWLVVQPWNAEGLHFYERCGAGGADVKARAILVSTLLGDKGG